MHLLGVAWDNIYPQVFAVEEYLGIVQHVPLAVSESCTARAAAVLDDFLERRNLRVTFGSTLSSEAAGTHRKEAARYHGS